MSIQEYILFSPLPLLLSNQTLANLKYSHHRQEQSYFHIYKILAYSVMAFAVSCLTENYISMDIFEVIWANRKSAFNTYEIIHINKWTYMIKLVISTNSSQQCLVRYAIASGISSESLVCRTTAFYSRNFTPFFTFDILLIPGSIALFI